MSYTTLGMVTTTVAAATIAAVGLIAGCSDPYADDAGTDSGTQAPTTAPEGSTSGLQPAARTVALQLSIKGMHCDGCVNTIASTVTEMDGVSSCEVSLEDESARITVADAAMGSKIVETINGLGYTAAIDES